MTRLLVASHPAVIAENQRVYAQLLELGWDVVLVVPHRWVHEYTSEAFAPRPLPRLEGRLRHAHVLLSGSAGRHLYLPPPGRLIRSIRPDVAFVEEETYAPVAGQWAFALRRAGIPFGVQADENVDRRLPCSVRCVRRFVLNSAAFVASRSPTAAALIRHWGGTQPTPLIPHAVPQWEPRQSVQQQSFVVGYAGRLVKEKGVLDLVRAVRELGDATRLLIVGDGPLRAQLEQEPTAEVRSGIHHDEMVGHYAEMDVLVLPSLTTRTWAEQFGRVLVEALYCGVPVVGSDSGEIPWVIRSTQGGCIFPEGNVVALVEILSQLRDDPRRRAELARAGRNNAIRLFGEKAAADAFDDALRRALRPTTPASP